MKIAVQNKEFFFSFFYILSFAVTLILVLAISIKRKIPLRSVLLMLTTVSLLTILGSRLIIIPINEWPRIFSSGSNSEYPNRSAIGGLIFGLAGLLFSRKLLGIEDSILKLYAWITPVGLGIQKIGCFFNGCCYGTPTDMPWSVQYPKGTNAHFHQWINGMIDENATFSSNIHPVQLYEMFFLFLIAFIVWQTRNFWKKKASALLFSLFLFFVFRFSIEFLRDPATAVFGNKIIFGVRLFQWLLLISGFVCASILFVNEKYFKAGIIQRSTVNPSLEKSIVYIFILSVLIFLCHGLFSRFELVSLDLKFIPAILLMAYYVFKSLAKAKFRLAATSFFIVPLFLITQTFFPDSAKTTRSLKSFYQNEVKTYKRIDFGTSIGDYYNELQYNPHEGQCGTAYTTEDYKHEFRMAGGGISFITQNGKIITTKGINLYGGSNKEINLTTHQENSYFLFGVNPYVKYDLNWLGFGAGLHVGNLRWVPLSPINEITFNRGTRVSPIMPEASLRLGRHDILDLRYDFGINFPTTFPLLAHGLSLGSGFGNKTNFDFRYGVELSNKNGYLQQFLSAEGLLSRQIGIRLKYSFGHAEFYNYSSSITEYKDFQRIQLGLNYSFGFNASPGKAGTK